MAGVDGYQFVQARADLRIVAALVRFVGRFVDVDDPTDATGVLAIGADATKGMIGPRLEPFYSTNSAPSVPPPLPYCSIRADVARRPGRSLLPVAQPGP